MTFRAALAILGTCWLAACSFPDYGFAPSAAALTICMDGLPSEVESGVDCGGGCPPCGLGETCEVATDCVTLTCFEGTCQVPDCEDGLKNGSETDDDCGGQCDRCPTGRDCTVAGDCESRVCTEGVCEAPTCFDGATNGDETSEDCGGGGCDPCGNGAACEEAGDCESGRCVELVCVSAACADGVMNGDETAADCGGPDCGPCGPEQACELARDCDSQICDEDLLCTAPACDDELQNGDESDVDCGGTCGGCANLDKCTRPEDCLSETCQSGLCVPSMPTQALLSRAGWTATAFATFNGDEPDGDTPNDALDGQEGNYWSSGETQMAGDWFEVDMTELNAFFTIQMMCNQTVDVPVLFDVYLSADGDFSDEQPVREDVAGFAPTTKVEFATAQVARYIRIELVEGKDNWWCIDEFTVYQ
jgi:hypothetical protein